MRQIFIIKLLIVIFLSACQVKPVPNLPPLSYIYNSEGKGQEITVEFTRGKSFNHPLFAIWVEDEKDRFIQTLYVSESIGKGVFQHGDPSSGRWMPGPIRRPASLPYWSHRRGIRASDGLFIPDSQNPVPDAYTGPTPPGDFRLTSKLDNENIRKFKIYFEVNQTWDWNEYWTNNKYPDDDEYKASCQPAVVYMAEIDLSDPDLVYEMKAIGHSHHSGLTGELFTDLSTLTTALQIASSIRVTLKN